MLNPQVVEAVEQTIVAARPAEQGDDVGRVIMPLLDSVWAFIRQTGLPHGRNVIVYRNGGTRGFEIVEAGVQVFERPTLPEGLVASSTPGGRAARALHLGAYTGIGASTAELRDWCAANGYKPTGPSWEVYGPGNVETPKLETNIYILIEDEP
jgi:effector-binding domain-containing protein